MTNLSQLSVVPNHFANGKHVINNVAGAQKNAQKNAQTNAQKDAQKTATKQCTDSNKKCYDNADGDADGDSRKLPMITLTDKTTQNNSKLIAKIEEWTLEETSKFANHLFDEHKKKLIELVENKTNLNSISCETSGGGDLYFMIQMFKRSHTI